MVKGEKQITLREAAELSGYSPDYLGQLIRKGKLQGEQVFSHVAWVTTETAVMEYMQVAKGKTSKNKNLQSENEGRFDVNFPWEKMTKVLLWFVVAAVVVFSAFLFYVTSVAIDDTLERKAMTTIRATINTLNGS